MLGRSTVEDDNLVSKVCSHDEIVLDDEGGLLVVQDESSDDLGADNTLLRVKVSGRLIDQVDVGWNTKCKDDGDSLQLTTRQVLDLLVDDVVDL